MKVSILRYKPNYKVPAGEFVYR